MKPPVGPTGPTVVVDEVSDLTAANAGIELIDQDAIQLGSTPLQMRRVIVRLGVAAIVFHSANLRMRSRTSVRQDLLAYVAFGARTTGTVNGLPVRPGLILAAEPGTEARLVTDAGWESVTFLLPPQELRAHLAARQRESEFRLPQGLEMWQASLEKGHVLFQWGMRLLDLAVDQPALLTERQEVRVAALADLFETLLATLCVANELEPSRGERTRQAYSLVVKLAEDYALSQTGENVRVSDLCRVAGVSVRTLEYAFREIMGLAPMAYLTRLRLHRVRRTLAEATRGATTVSAVALDWGFWHFGEFSRAYRECFGELPSDTLRRNPDQTGG